MQAETHNANRLPEPDAASLAHCRKVAALIREQIVAAGGSISFADFMQHALYAPGFGYYMAGARKFGAAGDFVTAPELSPLFGRVLARQCAEVFEQIGGGELLELGAGSGVLAVDLLRKLKELDVLPLRYRILEVSAELQERQQDRIRNELPEMMQRVEWLSDLPPAFNGVIVANEVADALPVERFTRTSDGIQQQRVIATESGFAWQSMPAPELLARAVHKIEVDIGRKLRPGYTAEISLGLPGWIESLAASLAQGLIFLCDYGVSRREYYAADRKDGWLRCHYRHRAHSDPLIYPGIQDLTAWVDFSLLAEAAAGSGLKLDGYAAQGPFLLQGGLVEELADFVELPTDRQLELSRQVKLLTLPGEMGENFKCMGLRRGEFQVPTAFAGTDRAHTL